VDVNGADDQVSGETALHRICSSCYDHLLPFLLNHPDIDVNVKNNSGHTPFVVACKSGKFQCVRQLLMDSRVRVNDGNSGGTALHVVSSYGSNHCLHLLLSHPDIDVNLKHQSGYTPFMVACQNGNIQCIRSLLKDGRVFISEPDQSGISPLYYAAQNAKEGVVQWIIASGRSDIDLGEPGNPQTDVIGIFSKSVSNGPSILSQLMNFKSDPAATVQGARSLLDISGEPH